MPTPEEFAASSLGAGAWETLSEDERDGFRDNGEVWREEMAEADAFTLDVSALAAFEGPALVTIGGASPPFWRQIADVLTDALPNASLDEVPGAGHLPHLSHATEYARVVREFASAAAAPR